MSQGTTPLINKPLVCARCITYNQAPYIVDAMNGFCMQQTTFPFVCAIIDDCSIDGEQEVIRNYLHKHFDLEDQSVVRNEETDDYTLTYARHKSNHNCFFAIVYLKYNHYSIGKSVRKNEYVKEWLDQVKYIALCEGDDYWTDPYKLQKQADYMEAHPKCGLVWAKAKCYHQESGKFKGITGGYMSGYYDMFVNYNISPLTCMYRQAAVEGYYDFVKGQKWLLGDSPLFLYIAHDNDIHFMDEIVGVYRVLKNSASHHTSYEKSIAFQNSTFDVVRFFYEKYGYPDFELLEDIHHTRLFNYAINNQRYEDAHKNFNKIIHPTGIIKIKGFLLKSFWGKKIYHLLFLWK